MNKYKKIIIRKAIQWLMTDIYINNGDSDYAMREYGIVDFYNRNDKKLFKDVITIKFLNR